MEAEGAARTTLEAEKKKEGDFDTTFRQVDFVLYAGLVLWWLHDRADMTCGIRFSWTRLFVCYLLSAFSVSFGFFSVVYPEEDFGSTW